MQAFKLVIWSRDCRYYNELLDKCSHPDNYLQKCSIKRCPINQKIYFSTLIRESKQLKDSTDEHKD